MGFFLRLIQTLLDKWYFPIATAIIVAYLSGVRISNIKESIKKAAIPIILATVAPVIILTLAEGKPDPKKDVFIRDFSSEYNDEGDAGLASLYDEKTMPIWFDDYFTEYESEIALHAEIDNTGKSYANIVQAKLIVDNYEPVSMDDILLFRGLVRSGDFPDKVKAVADITDIKEGYSEYDVEFNSFIVDPDGQHINGTERKIEKGEHFYVEESSRLTLLTTLKVNKSGIYTCHLKVDYEYYGEPETMETTPYTFIYLEGNESDYKFNKDKTDSFHLELNCYEENRALFYDIDGRTLRFHDSETIFRDGKLQDMYRLIDTIVVEDGTIELEPHAFWTGIMPLMDVSTMYLPKSLERIDLSCFGLGDLTTVYFGGSKEQWISMVNDSVNDNLDFLEGVDIVYDYGPMPTKEEELRIHQNEDSYYELYVKNDF